MDVAPIPSSTIWERKKGKSNAFSEAPRRTIKEMGNIELYELGETVRTTQCFSNSQRKSRIELTSYQILCTSSKEVIQENVVDQNSGNTTIRKQEMQQKEPRKETIRQLNTDGAQILHTKNRNCRTVGLLSTASTSTTSKPSTWTTLQLWEERDGYQNMLVLRYKDGKDHGKMSIRRFQICSPITCCGQPPGRIHTFLEVDDFDSDH